MQELKVHIKDVHDQSKQRGLQIHFLYQSALEKIKYNFLSFYLVASSTKAILSWIAKKSVISTEKCKILFFTDFFFKWPQSASFPGHIVSI